MKAPAQSGDLRSVSAYSVYNGLAGGMKSYQDYTNEGGNSSNKRRRKKKAKNALVNKEEEGMEKMVKNSTDSNKTLKEKVKPVHNQPPAAEISNGNASINSEKKKRKRKKKKATVNSNSEVDVTKNLCNEDSDVEEVRPAKASKFMLLPEAETVSKGKIAPAKKASPEKNLKSTSIKAKKKANKNGNLNSSVQVSENSSGSNKLSAKVKNAGNGNANLSLKKAVASSSSKAGVETFTIESKVPPPDIKSIFQKNARIEDSVSHGKDVLDWLLHPVTAEEFMKKIWEKKPVLIKRKHEAAEGYYKWLLTTQSFDDILRRNVVKFGVNLDVTSYENGVRETHSDTLQGRVRPAVVWDYYNNGCSIRMLNPQTFCQQIWKVNSSLQEWFGSFVGANVYLTPPNSQGFAPHYDDIEAFILQVEGKKQWKVYPPRSDNEKLPRFSSSNFSETEDNLGEPVLDVTLEEGDIMYFPRGWIHQAKTVEGEHSLHITLSCQQLNSFGDLLKHHVNHALDKLVATDVSFRQGLPTDYLSFMGIVHENTEDPELIRKRKDFSSKIKTMVSKLATVSPDFAADAMGKKFIWDSLPPFYTRKERETCVLEDGEFMQDGRVFNRVEFAPDVEVKLVRKNCVRFVVEEAALRLYYSTENSMVYHDQEAQFLEIGIEFAPAINHLITQYPEFTKVEDLPLSSNDIGQKTQIIADLWERGLILTNEPLEPCDDDVGLVESEGEDDEDVESVNLSDLPEAESSGEESNSSDEFYDTTMGYEIDSSENEGVTDDDEMDDESANFSDNLNPGELDIDFEEEESDIECWGEQDSDEDE